MDHELLIYRSYTHNVIWFLKITGLWPKTHPAVRKLRWAVTVCSTFVAVITVSNFSFRNINNVKVLTKGISVVVSFSSALTKAVIFQLYCDDLIYLNEHLSASFTRDMGKRKNHPDLLKKVKTFNALMFTHAASASLTGLIYILSALIALHKHGNYNNIYPAIYPFNYEPGGFVYWILFLLEMTAVVSLFTVTAGVDCAFGVYSFQVCGQLRILTRKFRKLRAVSNYRDKLKDCVGKHYVLVNAKIKLENVFGAISIWIAVSGALVICSLVFQITELLKINSYLRAFHLSVYLLPKFLQIFSYSWYGQLIAEDSAKCLDAMYYSEWMDYSDKNFKTDILIILAQKPLTLAVMGIMIIQFSMFTKVLNTSISYFFLLRTLNEENK